ncbi:MAG: recombinase family protein [Parachlamydiaceae bacterium]
MKVIGYLRVSTDQQAESGLGLEAQKFACEEYARKIGCEIHELCRDEGLSGSLSLDKRPGMLNAITLLKSGDILVVAKRDRLGRDPLVLAMIEAAITRKGARIVSAAGEGTDSDDPSSILMRRMIDAFGEYERLVIKARTKAALQAKKTRKERVGHIPFGYKLANDGIHLEENELEKGILKQMLKLRRKNLSIRDIAEEMNKRGAFNRGQAKWNHASVHRVIKIAA